MGLLIDIVIIAILALNIIIGYKKGLVNVIFNICAFLITIIITLILYRPVSNIVIKNTNIHDNIKTMIINNIQSNEKKEEKNTNNVIQEYIESAIQNTTDEAKSTVIEVVAENISTKCVEIITGIALFIIIRIILMVLKVFTETLANLPIVKQCNEIGGLVYGIIKGLLIIYILLTIIFFIISVKENGIIAQSIESSYVTKFLYNNNIIVKYCLLGKNLL